jgi:hypothetical protein
MTEADKVAYQELIEVAARVIAFTDIASVPLPKLVTYLQTEAVALRGGWDSFDERAPPGTQDLPVADQVADEVIARANQLRLEFAARLAAAKGLRELPAGVVRH